MNAPASFLISLGQCLATMSLYQPGHPARERAIDTSFERLVALLANMQFAEFSFLGNDVIFDGRVLEDLRSWDWAGRLAAARIERIEVDADVTRPAFERALEDMWRQLNGRAPETSEARQLVASPVRFGPLRVMGGPGAAALFGLGEGEGEGMGGGEGGGSGWSGGEGGGGGGGGPGVGGFAAGIGAGGFMEAIGGLAVSLSDEVATVQWIHEEITRADSLPMAEVEAVIGSLAVAMRAQQQMLLPLLMLKDFDQYTTTHACNVSVLAMGLAERLGCTRSEIRAFGVAGLLHDLGKVRIPRDILVKPGRLTDEERAIMQGHPVEGARILLERERGLQLAAVVAYEHHVCIDGKGYPEFKYARNCHYASRIVHVCDIYDALCTNRPYRKAWDPEQALTYLEERAGTEVDPAVTHAFTGMVREAALQRIEMPDAQAVVAPATSRAADSSPA